MGNNIDNKSWSKHVDTGSARDSKKLLPVQRLDEISNISVALLSPMTQWMPREAE